MFLINEIYAFDTMTKALDYYPTMINLRKRVEDIKEMHDKIRGSIHEMADSERKVQLLMEHIGRVKENILGTEELFLAAMV
jgi:hypothetical protein